MEVLIKMEVKDVCVCSHIHVEMDEGDVMSGIDPLYMAPSPE